ncbi:c-type cytochrome [Paracoccus shandongensis]|uniref:c-type cytochrome n=1 Tax=Paracoccus shandongensis TaxID=2816048 RepID=UPI003AF64656
MTGSRSSALFLSTASLLAVALGCIAIWAGWSYSISAQTQRGAALYAEHCGMCHGAQLEGQPD